VAASVTPMSLADDWQRAQAQLTTPFFDLIRLALDLLDTTTWPSLDALNKIALEKNICTLSGKRLTFIRATDNASSAMAYETHIASTGEIPTRANWHDTFNALQWLSLPAMKSTISLQHAELLKRGGANEARARSVPRDVLTMMDESGIIVASEDASLLELIRQFQWHTLFVTRRAEVIANMRFMLVGHGLMEKSLSPFVGITAKAMLVNIATEDNLEAAAVRWLADETNLQSARNLAPLPLLGIPGWDRRNEDAQFYQNTNYFRSGYLKHA
jgi:hypothetical protein